MLKICFLFFFFFSSRRRHTRFDCDWSSDVCSSDLGVELDGTAQKRPQVFGLGERAQLVEAGDRKSGVEGKRVDLGGRRIIKKKKRKKDRVECLYKKRVSSRM